MSTHVAKLPNTIEGKYYWNALNNFYIRTETICHKQNVCNKTENINIVNVVQKNFKNKKVLCFLYSGG